MEAETGSYQVKSKSVESKNRSALNQRAFSSFSQSFMIFLIQASTVQLKLGRSVKQTHALPRSHLVLTNIKAVSGTPMNNHSVHLQKTVLQLLCKSSLSHFAIYAFIREQQWSMDRTWTCMRGD